MNFFQQKTTWSNAELIPLKLCITSAYILVGAYFHDWVWQYRNFIIGIFIVTVSIAVYWWMKKMRDAGR